MGSVEDQKRTYPQFSVEGFSFQFQLNVMSYTYDPLEDACEDDKEPSDEDEDIDKVEADKTFNWDSNWVIDLIASVNC